MRIFFQSTTLAKKAAKRLSVLTQLPLSNSQEVVASMLGYDSWHELSAYTKSDSNIQSPVDEDCDPTVQMQRLDYQTAKLTQKFPQLEIASRDIAIKLRVSAKNPMSPELTELNKNILKFADSNSMGDPQGWVFIPSVRSQSALAEAGNSYAKLLNSEASFSEYVKKLIKLNDDRPEDLFVMTALLIVSLAENNFSFVKDRLDSFDKVLRELIPPEFPSEGASYFQLVPVPDNEFHRVALALANSFLETGDEERALYWFQFIHRTSLILKDSCAEILSVLGVPPRGQFYEASILDGDSEWEDGDDEERDDDDDASEYDLYEDEAYSMQLSEDVWFDVKIEHSLPDWLGENVDYIAEVKNSCGLFPSFKFHIEGYVKSDANEREELFLISGDFLDVEDILWDFGYSGAVQSFDWDDTWATLGETIFGHHPMIVDMFTPFKGEYSVAEASQYLLEKLKSNFQFSDLDGSTIPPIVLIQLIAKNQKSEHKEKININSLVDVVSIVLKKHVVLPTNSVLLAIDSGFNFAKLVDDETRKRYCIKKSKHNTGKFLQYLIKNEFKHAAATSKADPVMSRLRVEMGGSSDFEWVGKLVNIE